MKDNSSKVATEVWVLLGYSLGINIDEGLYALGVFETHEKAQIALARHYENMVSENDPEDISDLYYIKSTHLCDVVPKST